MLSRAITAGAWVVADSYRGTPVQKTRIRLHHTHHLQRDRVICRLPPDLNRYSGTLQLLRLAEQSTDNVGCSHAVSICSAAA